MPELSPLFATIPYTYWLNIVGAQHINLGHDVFKGWALPPAMRPSPN